MIRAQVFGVVAVAALAAVACTRKEDTATSETNTTSAESIPTVDLRSLPSALADNAGTNDTAGAPAAFDDKKDGGHVQTTDEKKDGGHVQAFDDKKDGGHVTAKPAIRAGHGGTSNDTTTTDEEVGPGHITTPALPRKAKQAPAKGEPNSAGSHNIGQ